MEENNITVDKAVQTIKGVTTGEQIDTQKLLILLWKQKLILIWVTRRIFLGLRQSEALLLGNSKWFV